MLPRILEYEDGRVLVTLEAYSIPEVKVFLDKYDMQAEPYLAYIHLMSSPISPYANTPMEERQETISYDVIQTYGDFDIDDDLIEPAIAKLKSLYQTPMILLAEELAEELHRFRKLLKNTPVTMGDDGNFKERSAFMKDIEKIATNYQNVKEKADKEIDVKMRGQNELGDY